MPSSLGGEGVVSVDGVIQDPLLESGSWESAYVEDQFQLFSALSTPIPRIVQGSAVSIIHCCYPQNLEQCLANVKCLHICSMNK